MRTPGVHLRAALDEAPQERGEATVLLLHREEGTRVADRRLDLETVPHEAGVGEHPTHIGGTEARDGGRIEAAVGAAIGLTLAQDGEP